MDFFTIPLRTTPGKCFQTVIGRNTAQRENQFPLDSYSGLGICCIQVHVHNRPLSSAEAKIYAATSACCDGVLLEYCLSFIVGGTEKVVTFIKMDNSAGRSFLIVFCGCATCEREGLIPSCVRSRENPADLGTKRLAKARMAKFNRTT